MSNAYGLRVTRWRQRDRTTRRTRPLSSSRPARADKEERPRQETHHSTFWSVACRLLVCVKNRFAIALQARSSPSAAVVGGERKRTGESRTHQSEVEMTSPTTKKCRNTNESTVLSVATAP